MDVREVAFWAGEASGRRARRISDMRVAMWGKAEDLKGLMESLMTPEERRAEQDSAWLKLKAIGRG